MKAARLLHLLLLLQSRQRITTGELAERLEVSRRTVLRDVEALSAAGLPVYAERGRNGGIVLLSGARLDVSRLDPGEMEALSLVGLDSEQLGRLGLAAAQEAATRKIVARQVVASGAATSPRLADLIVVDSSAWLGGERTVLDVADLASTLRQRRRMRIRYRRSAEDQPSWRVVDPYGLAAKSGRWYLVADDRGDGRLFALERLSGYELMESPAALRDGETLRTIWAELKGHVEAPGPLSVTVRLRRSRLDLARRVLGARIDDVSEDGGGWCTINVRYPDVESARQLLQFGDHIEVVAPQSARALIRRLAEDLAERHSPPR